MGNRVIYIIGAGRSGTTLLDIILGNASDIFSAGELNRFTKRNGIPSNARDEAISDFWLSVSDQLKTESFNEPRRYLKLAHKFEYHTSFYQFALSPYEKAEFKTYAGYQQALFRSIAKNAEKYQGKNIIVDSSKYPLRALVLAKIFQKDISFIYIKRDPSIVVESFQTKNIEQPAKSRMGANIYLLAVNALAVWAVKKLCKTNKVSVIRFDDLLSAPVAELERIEKDIGLDLGIPKQLIKQKLPLKVGYLFDGNRLRLNEQIVLREFTPSDNNSYTSKIFRSLHKLIWYQN